MSTQMNFHTQPSQVRGQQKRSVSRSNSRASLMILVPSVKDKQNNTKESFNLSNEAEAATKPKQQDPLLVQKLMDPTTSVRANAQQKPKSTSKLIPKPFESIRAFRHRQQLDRSKSRSSLHQHSQSKSGERPIHSRQFSGNQNLVLQEKLASNYNSVQSQTRNAAAKRSATGSELNNMVKQ